MKTVADAPLISVIVCTYQRPVMLRRALDSIVRQSLNDYEVIVVDDGSDPPVALPSLDTRVRIIRTEHRGVGAARAEGLNAARGQFVAYCDDDDEWSEDHLATRLQYLLDNPEVGLVYGDSDWVQDGHVSCVANAVDFDVYHLAGENYIFASSVMHRTSAARDVGGFDASQQAYEDWDLWLRMSRTHVIRHLPLVTGRRYWHDGCVSASDHWVDWYRVYGNHQRRVKSDAAAIRGARPPALAHVSALIAAGESFILIDEDEWPADELVGGRRRIPFPQRHGEYWKPPADGDAALHEFHRVRGLGPNIIAFARSSFWWLEYYPQLDGYLRTHHRCVLNDDLALVFDLRADLSELRQGALTVPRSFDAGRECRQGDPNEQQRWHQAGDLRAFERRVFSQNGEDGILEEILNRIGAKTKYFVEFGVESGLQCNCARLVVEDGWQGLFLEGDTTSFERLSIRYRGCPVKCVQAWVTSQNIEQLFEACDVPDIDVLSIDVDGNDYWLWSALMRWRPRVVVIEYNASYPPPRRWVMKENPDHKWDGTNYFGASLSSLVALAGSKGYALVATNSTGVNAFFVREDLLVGGMFPDPVVHDRYSPPCYGPQGSGHPPGDGPFLEI